jgi:hypothetical protein
MLWPNCVILPNASFFKERKKEIWHTTTQKTESDPWFTVSVNLIGPVTTLNNNQTHTLRALTMIDPATGWYKIVQATISWQ